MVSWKALRVHRDGDNRYVRYLYQNGGRWNRNYNWVSNPVNDHDFLAVPASFISALPEKFRESFV